MKVVFITNFYNHHQAALLGRIAEEGLEAEVRMVGPWMRKACGLYGTRRYLPHDLG